MSTTETKTDALLDAIRQDIAVCESMADRAMHSMEKLKPTTEEYKDANLQFGVNTYTVFYLRRIEEVVNCQDIKTSEHIIRFHHYQQNNVGVLKDHRDITLSQTAIAAILGRYIERFFN